MTAEAWALGEVRTILARVGDENSTATIETLREEVGIGHDDLSEVLQALRERGQAVEDSPGEWRRPFDGELDGAPDGEREMTEDDASEGPAPKRRDRAAPAVAAGDGEVVLTMAVAGALDAETIGKLVEAGIGEAKADGRAFVLRVSP
jgi:hypothetical protein